MPHPRGVAQSGSALALGARCRESKPLPPDQILRRPPPRRLRLTRARSSNWIEHQPSKLGVVGSTPAGRASLFRDIPANERKFPMIEVFTWPTPNGHKIHIMLEETGLEYEVRPVNIRVGEQFRPEFLRISPNNKIPAIVDRNGPDGKPITIFESGAILIYLAAKTGKLLPRDDRAKYVVLQWLMFQMGSVGPMMGQAGTC